MTLDKENMPNDIPGGKPGIEWRSSREDQWQMLNEKLDQRPKARQVFLLRPVFRYAVAAAISLLIVAGGFLRFSEVEYKIGNAERLSVELPDGSMVSMNAGSELSYYKYWWWANREVKLSGEAFFEVEKGEKFSVISNQGITEVLGTKFNVYARENSYKVTCMEGSVGVTVDKNRVELLPNETTSYKGGKLITEKVEMPENEISWRNNYYIFTAADIAEVIKELQRQYNVTINYSGGSAKYTGSFQQDMSIEQILNILSRTMDMQVERTGDTTFILK